jgi:hypothetical protein
MNKYQFIRSREYLNFVKYLDRIFEKKLLSVEMMNRSNL